MRTTALLTCLLFGLITATAAADQNWATRPVGAGPLSDSEAGAKVQRTGTDTVRPENDFYTHRTPTSLELALFRITSDMPYKDQVTGNFTGTTDEVLQWAGYKWGIDPDVVRAVAATETWWQMDFVGDSGQSFGLLQMKRTYHCCFPLSATSAAFNADYWAAIVRSYYDGKHPWLNTVPQGRTYAAGDIEGSIMAWYSGSWYLGGDSYLAKVKDYLGRRVWEQAEFSRRATLPKVVAHSGKKVKKKRTKHRRKRRRR